MTEPGLPPSEQRPGTDQGTLGPFRVGEPQHHLLEQAPVSAMDVDGLRVTLLGLVAFAVASVICAVGYPHLQRDGNGWWLGVCVSGFALGLVGLAYCLFRRSRRRAGRWDRD